MVNTLTPDGSNIDTSTTSVGTAGGTLSARQTLSYEYDDDGQLTKRTLSWAPGAEPDVTSRAAARTRSSPRSSAPVDVDEVTQSVTTTVAAGTPPPRPPRPPSTWCRASRSPTPTPWGGRRRSPTTPLGRRTKVTTPGGLVTTTSYTPTQTTVTTPDGEVTRTTIDLLGRTVSITDNVLNGALVADPGARTLSATSTAPTAPT